MKAEAILAKPVGADERFKKLLQVTKSLNDKFKTTTSLVKLGDRVNVLMPSIPSGLMTLDYDVIGTGGFTRGRIIEVFGPASSGKTTLCLHMVAQEQKLGGICAYVDAEHAIDPTYAHKLGVNVDDLLVSQPDCGEDALTTVIDLVESDAVSFIIVDSVAALVPRAELEGEMGESHMGLQARMMGQAMRKLTNAVSKHNVVVVFINQIREKIGVMFGSPETTTGGNALKFFSSIRLDIRRRKAITVGDTVVGHEIEIKAVKNKVGPPLRSTKVDLMYDSGFDTIGDFLNYGIKLNVIELAGKWYKFNGETFGNGAVAAAAELTTNNKLYKGILESIKEKQEQLRKEQ